MKAEWLRLPVQSAIASVIRSVSVRLSSNFASTSATLEMFSFVGAWTF